MEWFPEWIIGPTISVDATAFGRQFDQKQWAHAFGIGLHATPSDQKSQESYNLYEWGLGVAPPSSPLLDRRRERRARVPRLPARGTEPDTRDGRGRPLRGADPRRRPDHTAGLAWRARSLARHRQLRVGRRHAHLVEPHRHRRRRVRERGHRHVRARRQRCPLHAEGLADVEGEAVRPIELRHRLHDPAADRPAAHLPAAGFVVFPFDEADPEHQPAERTPSIRSAGRDHRRGGRRRVGRRALERWRLRGQARPERHRTVGDRPIDLPRGEGEGHGGLGQLGSELRHDDGQGQGSAHVRAAVREAVRPDSLRCQAGERGRHRPRRHRRHDHDRAVPVTTRRAPAELLQERRVRREPPHGSRDRSGLRRLLPVPLRDVGSHDQPRHGEGQWRARRRGRSQGRRDQGRDRGEGVRFVRWTEPDLGLRRRARDPRRALSRRLHARSK